MKENERSKISVIIHDRSRIIEEIFIIRIILVIFQSFIILYKIKQRISNVNIKG